MQTAMKKKKDRGLKRRVRGIRYWSEEKKKLDLNKLTISEVTFAKLPKEPLQNLLQNNDKLPGWINRSIFQSLFDIYFEWDNILKENYDEYYLKLWIYYPNIAESKVVSAVGEKVKYYSTLLDRDLEVSKFPPELRNIMEKCKKFNFRWNAYKDEIVIYESDYFNNLEYLESIKDKVYKVKEETEIGNSDRYYYIKNGSIWVGEAIFNSYTPNIL